ncbi:MAG: arginine repressor [Candidatus Nanopelagicales bacterium]|jgi:transcriptional regulator of arginine metabolism|nr:arginine repressor [Candidatus Nanopelagicales bacterium]MDP4825744.1 arginine repressor [Candidatus Nanopelagicales bacterium]MDP4888106.1 arginine repressor [Candidatus Nanopelagicales bacterium]
MSAPRTPAARRMRMRDLIATQTIHSQAQLQDLLEDEGFCVTQATVSRDLTEIGAVRNASSAGPTRYVLAEFEQSLVSAGPDDRLNRTLAELVVQAEHSANIVVVRTPPGAAQYLASVLDRAGWSTILGTVAGDDTVLLVTRDAEGGAQLNRSIVQLAEKGQQS